MTGYVKVPKVNLWGCVQKCRASYLQGFEKYANGIIVEIWMIKEEEKEILQELFPKTFTDAHNIDFLFKFSNTWRNNSFKRHNF